ncbi:28494_t:CDS:2 [Racocetra persica]|uniref:28494_t:CDS:1 n=1 Tax=Racocetra persica TaxID=160502 RepID=A0ACA9SI33_9GLOM|nr:28494_t:CDS:2 [Racocetra persica]
MKDITSSSTIAQDFKEIEQSVGKVYMSMSMMIIAVMRHHSNLAYYRLTQEENFDL